MVKELFERLFFALGKKVYSHPLAFLSITVLLTIVAIPGLMKLKLDSNMAALLPDENPVVKNLEYVSDVYGGLGNLVLVVRGKDPEKIISFLEKTSERMKNHKEVSYVEFKKPTSFFENHFLLFMETDDLQKIFYRIHHKFEYERKKNNPLLLDMMEENDPGLYFQDIIKKYENKYANGRSLIQKKKDDQFFNYYYKKEGETYTFAAFIKPANSALSVKYSRFFLNEMENISQSCRKNLLTNEMVEFTGRYKKSPDDFALLGKDFTRVTIVSLGGILAILLFYFRRIRSLVLLIIPLLMGIVWTLGFVGYIFGTLNLITTFLSSILMGLGIDYGIHLILRYREERIKHEHNKEPFLIMFSQTGSASFSSATTTAFGFLAISFTELKAFREFGIIASAGIILILIAMMFFISSALVIFERKNIQLSFNKRRLPEFLWKYPRVLLGVFAFFTVLLFFPLQNIWFDYDFSKIQGKHLRSHKVEKEINAMVGRTQNPTVIIPASMEEEKIILKKLNELIKNNKDNKKFQIHQAVGISTFIPGDQEKKIYWIRGIHNLLLKNGKYKKTLSQKNARMWDKLYQNTSISSISEENLPQSISRAFRGVGDQKEKKVILVFPKSTMVLGLDWIDYADAIHSIKVKEKPILAASDEMLFAEILKMIQSEGPFILTIAFLSVVVVVFLGFMNIPQALLVLSPLVVSFYWLLGFLGFIDMPVDFFNVIMFPIIVGIGIDSSIHIYHRYKEEGDVLKAVSNTGVAVILSTFTSMMGFGALMAASNAAIFSMGSVALWGLFFSLVTSLLGLPALLLIVHTKKKTGKRHDKSVFSQSDSQ